MIETSRLTVSCIQADSGKGIAVQIAEYQLVLTLASVESMGGEQGEVAPPVRHFKASVRAFF